MKSVTREWFKKSQYDLETAKAMFKSRRHLYVAFMCQQAVEKYLKGLLSQTSDTPPPFTHNLGALITLLKLDLPDEDKDFLDVLTRHYIANRYPETKQKLASQLNSQKSKELLGRTEQFLTWLKNVTKM